MAGRKGLLYEVLVGEALRAAFPFDELCPQHRLPGTLVRSDFVLYREGAPWLLVQVSHSRAETKQTQKFWRDAGELLQALAAAPALQTVAIVFDARPLAALERAASALVDQRVTLTGMPELQPLLDLSEAELGPAPLGRDTPWPVLRARLPPAAARAGGRAIDRLCRALGRSVAGAGWRASTGLRGASAPSNALLGARIAQPSRFYQGCAELMLVGPERRGALLRAAAGDDLGPLGLPPHVLELAATPTLFGQRPAPGLAWLARHLEPEPLLGGLAAAENPKAATWRAMARFAEHLPALIDTLRSGKHRRPEALEALLQAGFEDPAGAAARWLGPAASSERPDFNWPWTFLGALVRAIEGRRRSFGASRIAELTGERAFCLHSSQISAFECRARPLRADHRAALAAFFAEVLEMGLGGLDAIEARLRLRRRIFADKLGPHAVHPIPAFLRAVAARDGVALTSEWCPTSLTRRAGVRGSAGRVRVLGSETHLYWWRSAHAGHQADKAKEVGARIFGLTTTWCPERGRIERRPGARPLVLVVDGDFDARHLHFFQAAGADLLVRPQALQEGLPVLPHDHQRHRSTGLD